MRRILVLVLIACFATGGAEAYAGVPVGLRTLGAESATLHGGNGRAVVTRRGALLVSVASGRIRIVDLPGGGAPALSRTCRRRAHRVSAKTVEVRGRGVGCVVSSEKGGGPWQVIIRGRGIRASVLARGSLTLDAYRKGAPGTFRIGSGPWRTWPRRAHTYGLDRS